MVAYGGVDVYSQVFFTLVLEWSASRTSPLYPVEDPPVPNGHSRSVRCRELKIIDSTGTRYLDSSFVQSVGSRYTVYATKEY
jgi:hypothetical protein